MIADARGTTEETAPDEEPASMLETLAAAFRHATLGMAVVAPDGRIIAANPALCRAFGLTRDDLLAVSFAALVDPDDSAATMARLAASDVDPIQREQLYQRRDGSTFCGLLTVSTLQDDAGRFLGALVQVQDVTAQKEAETALRLNEAQLKSLATQLPVVIYTLEPGEETRFRYVSPQFEQLTGRSRTDPPTSDEALLHTIHPEDRAAFQAANDRADRTGEPFRLEYRLRGRDDAWVWVDNHAVLVRDEQGEPLAWHGALIDISERKRLEASLRESEERFRRAFEDAAIGMSLGTPDGLCLDANDAFCRIVGRSREALIGLPFAKLTHPEDRAASVQRHARLVAGEVDSYEVEKRYLRPDGTVVIGRLTRSAVRDDAGALHYTIGQLQDITPYKAAGAALRESEANLRTVLEQVPAAVYRLELGAGGRFTYTSPRFASLTGLSPDRADGNLEAFMARVHPDDVAALRQQDALAGLTGQPFDLEYRLRGQAGTWIWVHDCSRLMRDEGGSPVAWHGFLLDVSERKQLEASLHESQERFRRAFEDAAIGMSLGTPDDVCLDANAAYCRIVGRPRHEVIGHSFAALTHPADVADYANEMTRLQTGDVDVFQMEKRYVRPDGAVVTGLLTVSAVRDEHGRHLYDIGQLQDITAQKAAEAALRESQERFRRAFADAATGMAIGAPDDVCLDTNAAYCRIVGRPREAMIGHTFAEWTHPEDVADYTRQHARLNAGEIDAYQMEKRYLRPDGAVVTGLVTVSAVRDDAGVHLYNIGQIQDITARKEAEAALIQSEARFRSIFEGAGVGMTVVSPDLTITIANPALERMLGYGPGELAGRSIDDISFPVDAEQQREGRRRIDAGESDGYQLEKCYRRKDGSLVWALVSISAIRDEIGRLTATIGQTQDITARKEAEAALRESEALFRSIFEDAGIGMARSAPDGRIRVANPAFERLLGYAPGELQGVHVNAITVPADLPLQEENLRRAWAGEIDAYQMEKRYIRQDGEIVWGQLHASVVRDEHGVLQAVIAQVQDITARKEAEAALRDAEAALLESEARFRALVQNDPDIISVVDDRLHTIYVSPSAEAVLGVPIATLYGSIEPHLRLVHANDRERVIPLFQEVGQQPGATAVAEIRLKHHRLGWRWFHATIANLREDPGIGGFLVNLRDITDLKRAELTTKAALSTQQKAIAELERLNQSKSRFLATISHEFRTPLTAIIGYSELLAGEDSSATTIAEDAAVINREASRLNRMVDDILLVERLEAGQLHVDVKPVDLNVVVRNVVQTFRPLTDKHPIVLDLESGLQTIDGDADRLAQALTNLVSNAVKYSPAGGTVSIVTRNFGDGVMVSVRDEGIGIAAEDLPRIFDRFERSEIGTAGRIAGTGLGLSIVREIAGLHQGRVWAESKVGDGSTFHFSIPAERG